MNKLKTLITVISLLISTIIFAQSGYKVGDTVADFKLENVDGKLISLSDYGQAKGFIVIFTCNTCPFSVAYEDRIIALNAKYKPQGYPVIAIMPNNPASSRGDSMEAMQARAKVKMFAFPYLMDKNQAVYPQYGASKTPHVYVLQKSNKGNQVKYIGSIDDSYQNPESVNQKYVENAVDALLSGKAVDKSNTRALGCAIIK